MALTRYGLNYFSSHKRTEYLIRNAEIITIKCGTYEILYTE